MLIDVQVSSKANPEHGHGLGDTVQMLPVIQAVQNAAPDGVRVRVVTRKPFKDWVALGGFDWRAYEHPEDYPPASITLWPYRESAVDTDLRCLAENTNRQALWAANVSVKPARCQPHISVEARLWAKERHSELSKSGQKIAWLSPYAAHPMRTWSRRRWVEVFAGLEDLGCAVAGMQCRYDPVNVMWFPGPMFQDVCAERTAALFELADLYIGNDSGLTHLAGWLGVPSIAVLGTTNGRVVFGCYPTVRTIDAGASCAGCLGQGTRGWKHWCNNGCDALDAIAATDVLEMAKERLHGFYIPRREWKRT